MGMGWDGDNGAVLQPSTRGLTAIQGSHHVILQWFSTGGVFIPQRSNLFYKNKKASLLSIKSRK